jgi:type I restriction enzyme R subunit
MPSGEAFSRVKIDEQLRDVGWNMTDGRSVRYEVQLPDGTRADYVLADRQGRAMAVIEAKRAAVNPVEAEGQAADYASQVDVPFVFLANGEEIWFWEHQREAHPRPVETFFSQEDLERRVATLVTRVDPLSIPIANRIASRDYQKECIDTLCREMSLGRRKLLVEMATGAGKTRMAAALIKRLFEANAATRVLFLVDRITLANQTEDAFAEHLPDYPAYVLRAGRRFQDEKQITITTLQSMINVYRDYSSGYFDLVITDECHRSIYGKWSGVLKHFDGVQVGLTATPCVVPQEVLDNLPDDEDRLVIRDTLRFFEVDRPTFRYTLQRAIAEGYLVPYRIYKGDDGQDGGEGWLRGHARRARLARHGREDAAGVRRAIRRRRNHHRGPQRPGEEIHHPRAKPGNRPRVPAGGRERLRRQRWRQALSSRRQDHRFCGHQAPRRDPGPDVR